MPMHHGPADSPQPSKAAAPLVLITGASSGIGQALARRYYDAGWRLALVARRGEALEAWTAAQGFVAGRYRCYAADVREPQAMARVGATCLTEQGLPAVVIANAGISVGVDTAEYEDLDVIRAVFETNVLGMAATFQPFMRALCERRQGTLVGVASVAGIRGMPGHAAYCASKAAVISYCESLRGECRAYGVKVVTLVPGYIDTPLTRENRYPMPFLMSAQDFADAAFKSISVGERFRVIPWQMSLVAKLLRVLPDAWFDRAVAGQPRKQRPKSEVEGACANPPPLPEPPAD
jgi:short-subunit dehydrogenase